MKVENTVLDDGTLMELSDIRNVSELRCALATIDGELPTYDAQGFPLAISVFKPDTGAEPYVEVQ